MSSREPEPKTSSTEPYAPSDAHCWPLPPNGEASAYNLALYAAQLETRKKRTDQEVSRAIAMVQADLVLDREYYVAILEVAKSSIERARSSAETVLKAAATIVTLYTGILGVSFAVVDNPLPARALFAVFFLALAIVLSAVFLAYLPRGNRLTEPEACKGTEGVPARLRGDVLTDQFIEWCRETALQRVGWLRSSIVALAVALVFLPAPFVQLGGGSGWTGMGSRFWWVCAAVGLVLTALLPRLLDEDRGPGAKRKPQPEGD